MMADYGSPERERTLPTRRSTATDTAATQAGTPVHPLLSLQRQVGNAQIARMLAQRDAAPDEEKEDALQARHDVAQRDAAPDEEKEDALQARHDLTQRDTAPDEEKEDALQARHDLTQRHGDEEQIQAQPEVGLEGGPVSDTVANKINSQRGGGSPLDGSTRSTMESAFGTEFEDVRVHSDSESDTLNRNISAKAFTTGSDIFLRQDSSASDHNLMAHELTHVVQQRSMGSTGGGMAVGPAGDSHEQQADAVATAVTSGQAAPQRKADDQAA
jgi:hypothetical protein